jgi:hypothetical protein
MMILKSILVWLCLIPLAIINGAFREIVLAPLLGWYAQPLSGLILIALIFAVCLFFIHRLGKAGRSTYIAIGAVWVFLTIAFEFSFGLATGASLQQLLEAYDITTGNLWLVVLIAIGLSPWAAAKIRGAIIADAPFGCYSHRPSKTEHKASLKVE